MQRLEVSCAVRPIYGSLGAKGLTSLAGETAWLEGHYVLHYNLNAIASTYDKLFV
jgi:hypothetical protein